MPSLVSIIIPTYNRASLIGEAIQSCLNQTYQYIEVIVIDDGSTDNTKEIVSSFNDSRILYCYQDNAERSVARNNGLDRCKGDYIQFLDADDIIYPTKIARQVDYLDRHPHAHGVYGVTDFFNSTGITGSVYKDYKEDYFNHLVIGNFIPINAMLVRRSAQKFDESMNLLEDWKYLLELALVGNRLYGEPVNVCGVRLHSGNSSADKRAMLLAELKILNWISAYPVNRSIWKYALFTREFQLLSPSWPCTLVGALSWQNLNLFRIAKFFLRFAFGRL